MLTGAGQLLDCLTIPEHLSASSSTCDPQAVSSTWERQTTPWPSRGQGSGGRAAKTLSHLDTPTVQVVRRRLVDAHDAIPCEISHEAREAQSVTKLGNHDCSIGRQRRRPEEHDVGDCRARHDKTPREFKRRSAPSPIWQAPFPASVAPSTK